MRALIFSSPSRPPLHIWQLQATPFFDTLLGDANGYDKWAQRLAGGDWIGSESFTRRRSTHTSSASSTRSSAAIC
jgi:hypothetical protein